MFVSDLVFGERGYIKGLCRLCGRQTIEGFPLYDCISERFTMNIFYAGDCLCPGCAYLVKTQELRRHSWVLTREGLQFLKASEVFQTLFDPPEPPFAIHVIVSGKKPTYLRLRFAATNRQKYLFSYEGSDTLVLFDREIALEYAEIVKEALAIGLPKRELKTGVLSPSSVQKLAERGASDLFGKIKEIAPNPLWEVLVHVGA